MVRFFAFAGLGIWFGACGSRSSIPTGDGTVEVPCQQQRDCDGENLCQSRQCVEGFCHVVSVVSCDDSDACTRDSCVPRSGQCESVPRTSDEDGDGYRGALPGMRAGETGACGDDCDDTSAKAYPGATEQCDGADNDCNGIVDDGASYGNPSAPVLVSDQRASDSLPHGMSYANGDFAIVTQQRESHWKNYFQTVAPDGSLVLAPSSFTPENSEAMQPTLVWTGAVHGLAWTDHRSDSLDIYFNRLDVLGKKFGPDVRITETQTIAIQPSLVWDGSSWILAYCEGGFDQLLRVFVVRLDREGNTQGEAQVVTDAGLDAQGPRLVRSARGLSLFYYVVGEGYRFLRLDSELTPEGKPIGLPFVDVEEVSFVWNGGRYLLAWSTRTNTMSKDIMAMALGEDGEILVAPQTVAVGTNAARSPAWVALGDRAYLVWADDRDTPGVFELSGQMLDSSLKAQSDRNRLTSLGAETYDPQPALGGGGLGVLFRSRKVGPWQSYFVHLDCMDGT